ncbi:hypothetical protein [Cellulosimicrobium sp. NPDC055967]|uniref:hypothetical protein n=1 Tax=Cellulosimicrobium sp. NPDC055967 TaxID=3345670 RepID=UPI0035DDEBE1
MNAANWIALVAVIVSPLVSIYVVRTSGRREDERESQRRLDALDYEGRSRQDRRKEHWLDLKREAYTKLRGAMDDFDELYWRMTQLPWNKTSKRIFESVDRALAARDGMRSALRELEFLAPEAITDLAREYTRHVWRTYEETSSMDILFSENPKAGAIIHNAPKRLSDEEFSVRETRRLEIQRDLFAMMRRDLGFDIPV